MMANKETLGATGDKPKRTNPYSKPRPAYLLVKLPEGVTKEQLDVVNITRKADEALEAKENDHSIEVIRVMVK